MVITSFGLTSMGFFVAWLLDNVQAYHAIQMTVLVPLWVLSGSMFPVDTNSTLFATIMEWNPVSYAVTAIRHALYGGIAPLETVMIGSGITALTILSIFAAGSFISAVVVCEYRR